MMSKWGALGAGVLALVLVASTFDTAEARRGGGFRSGGYAFSGRSFAPRFVGRSNFVSGGVFRHRHRHFGRGFVVGVPLAYGAYYGYGYGYGNSRRWLWYRALDTGSRYWWARYYDCVNGYY